MIQIKRALLSVSDKSGLVELARFLEQKGVELLSTGGTLKALSDAKINAKSIESYTGFPEMMEGRLKTLHPKIHGGILSLLDRDEHVRSMKEHGIESIDLVVVNLYPFSAVVAKGASFDDAIENIDIGGPTMLRAAAKNYRFTTSICDPADYPKLIEEIEKSGGIGEELSLEFARKTFNHTASYDAVISSHLNGVAKDEFPETLTLTYQKVQPLRYGENPHQQAAFYRPVLDLEKEKHSGFRGAEQIQGKELSFNNMLDFSSALTAAISLPGKGVVIVKHLNPCGAAMTYDEAKMSDAFVKARSCDPASAFGGVIAINGVCDDATAKLITENFVEGVIAEDFSPGALALFSEKKNVRLLRLHDPERFLYGAKEIRQVYDGILYEDVDTVIADTHGWKTVTHRSPTESEMRALAFAWRLVHYVKSNAIVLCTEEQSIGIGAGQMSRVDSVEIAAMKARKNGFDPAGSVAGSDAFFPFRDNIDVLASAGVKAIIQPGGSIRDEEVIEAANEHEMAMIFTGMRHFRH